MNKDLTYLILLRMNKHDDIINLITANSYLLHLIKKDFWVEKLISHKIDYHNFLTNFAIFTDSVTPYYFYVLDNKYNLFYIISDSIFDRINQISGNRLFYVDKYKKLTTMDEKMNLITHILNVNVKENPASFEEMSNIMTKCIYEPIFDLSYYDFLFIEEFIKIDYSKSFFDTKYDNSIYYRRPSDKNKPAPLWNGFLFNMSKHKDFYLYFKYVMNQTISNGCWGVKLKSYINLQSIYYLADTHIFDFFKDEILDKLKEVDFTKDELDNPYIHLFSPYLRKSILKVIIAIDWFYKHGGYLPNQKILNNFDVDRKIVAWVKNKSEF